MKKLIYSPDYKEKLIKLRKKLDMEFDNMLFPFMIYVQNQNTVFCYFIENIIMC